MSLKRNATLKEMIATAKRLGFYVHVSHRWSKGEQTSQMYSSPSPNDGYAVNVCNDGRWIFFEFPDDRYVATKEGRGKLELIAFIGQRFPTN